MAVGEDAGKVPRSKPNNFEGGGHLSLVQGQDSDCSSRIMAANEAAGLEWRTDADHAGSQPLFDASVNDALVGVIDEDDLEQRPDIRRGGFRRRPNEGELGCAEAGSADVSDEDRGI
jgi:hypothetical protein